MSHPEKEATIYDIAKKLNISAATVSRGLKDHPAISISTKKKIQLAASEMGYRSNIFASNLRKKSSNIIGVIVPRLNSSFMSDVIAGMEQVANESGYNIIISQSLESFKKEVANAKAMFNNRIDGLLVSLAYNTENIAHFKPFVDRGIPVIFFDRVSDQTDYPTVSIDNYRAAYNAVAHLVAQGCKKIAHITGSQLRNVYHDRYRGYCQALADHDYQLDEKLVFINNLALADGEDVAHQILAMDNRPDGVFCANDSSAIGCMLELKRQGIQIPREIAFVGFNNDPVCCVIEPNLTTINYKGYEMGGAAARVLISSMQNLQDVKITDRIILRSELIIRASSQKDKKQINELKRSK